MKIVAILDSSKGYHVKRFIEDKEDFPEIDILFSSKLVYPRINRLLKYDTFFIYSPSLVGENSFLFSRKLALYNKTVINKTHYKIGYISKALLYTLLSENNILVPKFFRIFSIGTLNKLGKLNFPIVAKHSYKHRGSEVELIEDIDSLKTFIKNHKDKLKYYIFQKYIEYKKDIRLIYVGNKVLGAIQRFGKDFRANISLGGYAKKCKVNSKIKSISDKISELLHANVFSIDILKSKDNEYYVIDFHNIFQFKGFENVTGKKVPKSIYEFLVTL